MQDNLKILDEIKEYKKGWNGHEAPPFSSTHIDNCKEVIKHLDIQPIINPTARKSILFQWNSDTGELCYEISEFLVSKVYIPKNNDRLDFSNITSASVPVIIYPKIEGLANMINNDLAKYKFK